MFRANFWSVKVLFVTTLCTIVLLAGSLVLGFYGIGAIIDYNIKLQTQLKKGSDQWDRFVDLPPLEFKVWFWDVQNADDIVANGSIPNLKEVGPFIFDQAIRKNVEELNADEDSVSYYRNITLTFNEAASGNLRLNQTIKLPNPAFLASTQMASAVERLVLAGCLNKIFKGALEGIFIDVTVEEILFKGIVFAVDEDVGTACGIVRERLIEKAKPIRVVDRLDKDGNVLDKNDDDLSKVYSLRLAFLASKIERSDGRYTVNRGMVNISQLGQIMRWNNEPTLDLWGSSTSINNDTCKRIRGTDSTIYAPHVTSSQQLEVYNTDICRFVALGYTGTSSYNGINGYIFETDEHTLKYTTPNAENDCYCTKMTSDINGLPSCFLDGILDLMPCIGAPVLLSFPHFLHAPNYADQILGMAPDAEIHKISLLLEPNTGSPLQGKERVQMNMVLRPEMFLLETTSLPRVVIPMFWIEEGINLPQKYVDMLNNQYFGKLKLAMGLKYGLIATSAALVTVSLAFLIRKKCIYSRHKH